MLLGILDIQNTPCARGAVLHGSAASILVDVGHFLATSRVKRSFNFAVGGFMLTTLGSWFYCRYNNAKLRMQQKLIQGGLKNKVMYEGTSLDPTGKQNSSQGGGS
ncbi:cytochrome c oxidase assembly protein COX20 [Huso huso]|uniref:Cytochrome c oxidase assembly protein COX20, mitochondrial n=1 Tax=Huso huso TaxID=61971 RepID=A0ABR0ZYJ4_HUSHU